MPAHPNPPNGPQFPGLINGCTIDWYLPWPEEALTAVSSKFLDSFAIECTPEVHCYSCRLGWGAARGVGTSSGGICCLPLCLRPSFFRLPPRRPQVKQALKVMMAGVHMQVTHACQVCASYLPC